MIVHKVTYTRFINILKVARIEQTRLFPGGPLQVAQSFLGPPIVLLEGNPEIKYERSPEALVAVNCTSTFQSFSSPVRLSF
jgi:hypothetical protein